MNFFRTITAATMVVAAMSLSSCKPDDNGGDTEKDANELSGTVTDALVLDQFDTYKLTGPLIVKSGATLTIPAGTTIEAIEDFSSYILVLQGGRIFVNGTSTAPVTMTLAPGSSTTAGWGGLVINGKAPLEGNTVNGEHVFITGSTEISSAYPYGGDKEDDNSGSITYLKLLYTGNSNGATVEHNGLTLNGVGNGTKIENIFVKDGKDDGIEFFGGSVNVTNLLVVNSDDDMFDFTRGYTGTLKNAYGIWEAGFSSSEGDPGGVEADGNLDGDYAAAPDQSDFTIEDMTIDIRNTSGTMNYVLCIRREAKATITNALVKGSGAVNIFANFDSGAKFGADTATEISVTNDLSGTIATPVKYNVATNTTPAMTAADYPDVNLDATGNTGADKSVFAWTGYTI